MYSLIWNDPGGVKDVVFRRLSFHTPHVLIFLTCSAGKKPAKEMSFLVVVPGDPIVAHVGSTGILPCWISPPENAEALEIRWYRHDQFNNPVLLYNHGKIQDIQECFRNRSSLALRSDQSGGLKDGDVSLRLEKLTFQDEGSFHCYVSGDREYGSKVVDLKITEWSSVSDPSVSSGPWKALFFTVLIVLMLMLSLVGCLYKYRDNLTGTIWLKDLKDVVFRRFLFHAS
uniref:Ig-like domain-containing protein n=1 Tax=Sinocyclocheilus grahami TaxID=75366 RepID=A0A672KRX0_SINGR